MTNEEKAREIQVDDVCCVWNGGCPNVRNGAMKMAQWKDEQFDKKLQEIVDYVYPLICGGERLHINEIIGKDMVWKH